MNLREAANKITPKKWTQLAVVTIALFVVLACYVHATQLGIRNIFSYLREGEASYIIKKYFTTFGNLFHGHYGERFKIFFTAAECLFLVFWFRPSKSLPFLYRYRWLFGLLLWIFCTANCYHGDSIGAYNLYIEPGEGSELNSPIIGEVRLIRSDEWAISTPAAISSSYGEHPYGKYNELLRGGHTLNSTAGIYLGYSTLAKNFFYYFFAILGVEYGFSCAWCGQIIFTFLVSVEFMRILTKDKKLPAVTGAFLVTFSSYYFWWKFPKYIWTMEACLLCFYYLLQQIPLIRKILFGAGFGVSFAAFCLALNPPWQVSFGYTALVMAAWILCENREKLKDLVWKDYLVVVGMLLFSASLILSYMKLNEEYIEVINQTVYPGKRFSTGGGYYSKIFYYFQSVLYPFREVGVTSELSGFAGMFPLPVIGGIYYFIKDRKRNLLPLLLSLLLVPYLLFVTTGLPEGFCRVTLLSRVTTTRMCDAIGYICILLLVYLMSKDTRDERGMVPPKGEDTGDERGRTSPEGKPGRALGLLPWKPSAFDLACMAVSFGSVVTAAVICKRHFPDYMPAAFILAGILVWGFAGYGILQNGRYKVRFAALCVLIFLSLVTGLFVRPVMKGFDAVWSKPSARKIMEIAKEEPDALWIGAGESFYYQGYLSICGAKCLNTTNIYPNLEVYRMLDREGKYEDIYNRYGHMNIRLTDAETSMGLEAQDCVLVYLNYKDLQVLGVDYLFTREELSDYPGVHFENVYAGEYAYIYRVIYAQPRE